MRTTISTYIDDGRVFEYYIVIDNEALAHMYPSARPESREEYGAEYLGAKAREHAAAIVKDGYRHNDGLTFEHYPPHRILKVKVSPAPSTSYPDKVRGT